MKSVAKTKTRKKSPVITFEELRARLKILDVETCANYIKQLEGLGVKV